MKTFLGDTVAIIYGEHSQVYWHRIQVSQLWETGWVRNEGHMLEFWRTIGGADSGEANRNQATYHDEDASH